LLITLVLPSCARVASCAGLPTEIAPGAPNASCSTRADPVDPERMAANVRELARSPRFFDDQRYEARTWLTEQLTAAGRAVDEQPFDISGVFGTNLLARGSPGARVLVAAHYDTVEVSPGADDNASGVAVVLEVARVLGPDAPFDVVLFDLEEPQGSLVGRDQRNFAYGSQAFVDAGISYDLAFVLESVGVRCEGCQQVPGAMPSGLVEVDGNAVYWIAGGDAPWADLVATFGAAAAPTRAIGVFVPGRGGRVPETRFSDHAPLWDAGIPAVMVTDTALLRNPSYHRATDLPDTVDPEFLGAVARW
jgi:hypothetical protein